MPDEKDVGKDKGSEGRGLVVLSVFPTTLIVHALIAYFRGAVLTTAN